MEIDNVVYFTIGPSCRLVFWCVMIRVLRTIFWTSEQYSDQILNKVTWSEVQVRWLSLMESSHIGLETTRHAMIHAGECEFFCAFMIRGVDGVERCPGAILQYLSSLHERVCWSVNGNSMSFETSTDRFRSASSWLVESRYCWFGNTPIDPDNVRSIQRRCLDILQPALDFSFLDETRICRGLVDDMFLQT